MSETEDSGALLGYYVPVCHSDTPHISINPSCQEKLAGTAWPCGGNSFVCIDFWASLFTDLKYCSVLGECQCSDCDIRRQRRQGCLWKESLPHRSRNSMFYFCFCLFLSSIVHFLQECPSKHICVGYHSKHPNTPSLALFLFFLETLQTHITSEYTGVHKGVTGSGCTYIKNHILEIGGA